MFCVCYSNCRWGEKKVCCTHTQPPSFKGDGEMLKREKLKLKVTRASRFSNEKKPFIFFDSPTKARVLKRGF